ncbi:hypothetical protein KAS08_02470 [Candidatus Pacearchaeota archaeon]|nr:hypothetical protein [Candidatus Pacearchaeota archaeon]
MGFSSGGGEILDGSITSEKLNGNVLSPIFEVIQENAIQMLINSAGASTTLNDWEDMIVDRFIDADGQLESVDIGNTTSIFDNINSKYSNASIFLNATQTGTTSTSYVLQKTISCNDSLVKKGENELKPEDGGGTRTAYCKYEFNYTDSSTDSVEQTETSTGSVFVAKTYTNPNPEKTIDNIKIYTKSSYNLISAQEKNDLITFFPFPLVVQINAEVVDAGIVQTQLFCHREVAGSGNVTYNVSLDGGSTWTTDLEPDVKNTITSADGTSLIAKINLNGAGVGNIANIEDFALMSFY